MNTRDVIDALKTGAFIAAPALMIYAIGIGDGKKIQKTEQQKEIQQ